MYADYLSYQSYQSINQCINPGSMTNLRGNTVYTALYCVISNIMKTKKTNLFIGSLKETQEVGS